MVVIHNIMRINTNTSNHNDKYTNALMKMILMLIMLGYY